MLAGRRHFFVRQHAAVFKLSGAYDILDPATQQLIGSAKEMPPTWAKFVRLLVGKEICPTMVEVREVGNPSIFLTLHKGPGLLRHTVTARDGMRKEIGVFRTKLFSWRSCLLLYGSDGRPCGEVKGDWKRWNFAVRDERGHELATISKKWAGIGKELFTTADSYMIALSDSAPARAHDNNDLATFVLAAGLAIDLVIKEEKN
jgi:uncharacterized protein YxjI